MIEDIAMSKNCILFTLLSRGIEFDDSPELSIIYEYTTPPIIVRDIELSISAKRNHSILLLTPVTTSQNPPNRKR